MSAQSTKYLGDNSTTNDKSLSPVPAGISAPPSPIIPPGALKGVPVTATSGSVTPGSRTTTQAPHKWEQTLKKVIPAIVAIRFVTVRYFDTEIASSGEGTGFFVDAERGIILTNRHLVNPGPILASAVLYDHEEFPIVPIYRDPVHDFGFFQLDVSKVKYMKIVAIPLAPQLAKVGMDVRVVGNDNAEKLSILAGTLARTDREAPRYGYGYNDFNTFYFQAASMTSGGSSGSPVLDIDANAIALNAGGASKGASSFFLPLDRVLVALKHIQNGETVPRGTLQTIFRHQPFDEARRLGLKAETEKMIRQNFRRETGMLCISDVIPKSPADGVIEPGDVLIAVNDQNLSRFASLSEVLDSNVGNKVQLSVERGEKSLTLELPVSSLHDITPDKYLEFGGAILHDLSYQIARSYKIPCGGGVYVANPGYMLRLANIHDNICIIAWNDVPVRNVQELIEVVKSLPDKLRVPIRYFLLNDFNKDIVTVVQMERTWHPMRLAQRNGSITYVDNLPVLDKNGLWEYVEFPPPPVQDIYKPANATFVSVDKSLGPSNLIIPSLVEVNFSLPYKIDGYMISKYFGIGLVIDAKKGLVVIERNTVVSSIGDVTLTFASSIIVPGKLVYLHPLYNFAIVQYSPHLLGSTPVKSAVLSEVPLAQGDKTNFVGLELRESRPVFRKTTVSSVNHRFVSESPLARFRPINLEAIQIEMPIFDASGVLCDDQGKIQALWATYSEDLINEKQNLVTEDNFVGFPIHQFKHAFRSLQNGEIPNIFSLELELNYLPMSLARSMNFSDQWVKKFEEANTSKRNVLGIRGLTSNAPSYKLLKEGDIILSINGKPATVFADVENLTNSSVDLEILRDKKEIKVKVPLSQLQATSTSHIISWCGAILQAPNKPVYQQHRNVPNEIYVSFSSVGSPASQYGLYSMNWVLEINGVPVKTLQDFLREVKKKNPNGNDDYVRLKIMNFNRMVKVISVRVNQHYFPTTELLRDETSPSGWKLLKH